MPPLSRINGTGSHLLAGADPPGLSGQSGMAVAAVIACGGSPTGNRPLTVFGDKGRPLPGCLCNVWPAAFAAHRLSPEPLRKCGAAATAGSHDRR